MVEDFLITFNVFVFHPFNSGRERTGDGGHITFERLVMEFGISLVVQTVSSIILTTDMNALILLELQNVISEWLALLLHI